MGDDGGNMQGTGVNGVEVCDHGNANRGNQGYMEAVRLGTVPGLKVSGEGMTGKLSLR